ncbi:HD domain-containing protein [Draconibacterium sp. IB214405]|uniref:HD domain-containing protein n=1 Tax=Draconibacterium sp. IB214405 TaxID=3097352 RepID=UPI002A1077FE|nr:HD domain-containing protein [Draconibacterium sp. IB214405]MDX8341001.1 HD domain-containing protein [Draconibacterium sp. IB214405]
MEKRADLALKKFNDYVDSFSGWSEDQIKNLEIKREHSFRVAQLATMLAGKMELNETETYLAYLIGLFHDIGRFKQLKEFNTFNDAKSVDHADYAVEILKENNFFEDLDEGQINLILLAISQHNKLGLSKKMSDKERLFAQLIRDADKLDILRVLTDYYTNPKATPNHTLTWEMPRGVAVSPKVSKQILNGDLVSKDTVASELDIKVMQLSWVYDLNYRQSFEVMVENRYVDKIYNSMPKNDTVIEIYRKIKVYIENKVIA